MRRNRTFLTPILNKASTLLILLILASCTDIPKTTTLEIIEPNRHYYPIIQGDEVDLIYEIKNTGKVAFEIDDVITSCGCVVVEDKSILNIAPENSGILYLTYDSSKNIGFVKNYVYLLGNLKKGDKKVIEFDINVVPHSKYETYEEYYNNEKKLDKNIKGTVNSGNRNKYYVD